MRTRTRTILAGLVLAAALVGGVAWAAIPGTDGTIQGCYTKSNGNLRVVASADACRKSETAISWNQKGQRGATGAAGANGLDGAKGDKGDPGATGATGANGVDGKDGANGRDGADGAAGTDGVSVTSQALPVGDANCANGGSKFTAADGATYACHGAPGSAGGSGSVAAKGWIRFLSDQAHLNWNRGVASVSVVPATGEFSVVYATPSPCGPGSRPVPQVAFRNFSDGRIFTISESETGFVAMALSESGAPLTTVTDQIDFTFIVAC